MPKLATTHSLSNYQKLKISAFRDSLKQYPRSALSINYTYKDKQYDYQIKVSKTPCNYGNYRYWFLCPNCNKRVGILYLAGIFVCRHCIGANYACQLEQPLDKLFRKVAKIRHRLQWQVGIAYGHGAKPKGMHQTTFNRLVKEHDRIAEYLFDLQERWIDMLNSQIKRKVSK